MSKIILQAHRGVSTDYPENTMSAFLGAVVQGYPIIETDPIYTKDGEIVLFHDKTLNRTARYPDGTSLKQEVAISELSYDEAQLYDYGIWFGPQFKGERLVKLADLLMFASKHRVEIKIDNKIQAFPLPMLKRLFEIIESSSAQVGITSSDVTFVKMVHDRLPHAPIHYDGIVTETVLQELSALIPRERLTVWLPYPTKHNAWVRIPFVNETMAELVKKYARLGLWILSEESEYEDAARRFQPDVVETTGKLKPQKC